MKGHLDDNEASVGIGASLLMRRLSRGIVANLLGKLWVILVQIISIPILTMHWGTEGYGAWLMLITIPTYISLSDFGFGTSATVELTRKAASGDLDGAREVFQSAWSFVTAISLIAGICVAAAATVLVPADFARSNSPAIGIFDANVVLVVLYSLLIVQTQLVLMIYRATNKYATGTFLLDILSLLEAMLQICCVALGGDITQSLLVLSVSRAATLLILYFVGKQKEPWASFGRSRARMSTIRALAAPSLGAVALNIANSFAIQGVVMTLGVTAGATAVATFATARLITRVPLQFSGLVTRASIPELTRAIHDGRKDVARRLTLFNVGFTLAVALPSSIALLAFGPQISSILSHGALAPGYELFVPLVFSALVSAIWASLATPLLSTNRHTAFSFVYLASSLATVAVPFFTLPPQEVATAWAIAGAEMAALVAVVVQITKRARR